MNGTFTFSHDLTFNAANPRSYPEVFAIRVPGAVDFLMKGHFIGAFAQDKWRLNTRLTLTLGARYDVEVLRTPNQDNPLFAGDPDGYPMDTNNVSPRLGFSYALDSSARSVLRGGYGIFFQRTSYTFLTAMFSTGARFSNSFTARCPTSGVDTGPRNGNFPSNACLQGGPVVNHTAIDAQFPPGSLIRNVGTVRFDNPDREVAWARQYSIGYERQLGTNLAVTVDYIRSEQRKQYALIDLNPPTRSAPTVAGGSVTRTNPLPPLQPGEFVGPVNTITNDGWDRLRHRPGIGVETPQPWHQRTGLLCLLPGRRKHGNGSGRHGQLTIAGRPAVGQRDRTHQRRSAPHPVDQRNVRRPTHARSEGQRRAACP